MSPNGLLILAQTVQQLSTVSNFSIIGHFDQIATQCSFGVLSNEFVNIENGYFSLKSIASEVSVNTSISEFNSLIFRRIKVVFLLPTLGRSTFQFDILYINFLGFQGFGIISPNILRLAEGADSLAQSSFEIRILRYRKTLF